MRSVRLPILVPHREGSSRMSSAMGCSLRCRGPSVAVRPISPRGVQTIAVTVLSRPGAGCVNRLRPAGRRMRRSRSSSGRQLRGLALASVSVGFMVGLSGFRRCSCGQIHSSVRSQPGPLFDAAAGARVLSAQELMQLSQSFTHGRLTTRSSGPAQYPRGRASGAPAILRRPRA